MLVERTVSEPARADHPDGCRLCGGLPNSRVIHTSVPGSSQQKTSGTTRSGT